MPAEERDPSQYVTSPPSIYVQVKGTARDDINGLLGIAISYNTERERYLVHMTKSQSTMAFRKDNLIKASLIDTYRGQWQQIQNDPRVRHKMAHYITQCQEWVQPAKLSHVVGFLLFLICFLLYFVGITKTIMTCSLLILLGIIAAPDILHKESPKTILLNFPRRSRETMEQHMPMLRGGKLSNRMALGIVLCLIALCLQSLFFAGRAKYNKVSNNKLNMKKLQKEYQQRHNNNKLGIDPIVVTNNKDDNNNKDDDDDDLLLVPTTLDTYKARDLIEKYYKLGYDDATNNLNNGNSLDFTKLEDELVSIMKPITSSSSPKHHHHHNDTITTTNTIQQDATYYSKDYITDGMDSSTTTTNENDEQEQEEQQEDNIVQDYNNNEYDNDYNKSSNNNNILSSISNTFNTILSKFGLGFSSSSDNDDDEYNNMEQESRPILSLTNMSSLFYLYRIIVDLGIDRQTGFFSMAQLFANLHKLPVWRKILLGLSFYNIIRIVLL